MKLLRPFRPVRRVSILLMVAALGLTAGAATPAPKLKVLIVDGQNNHAWATTTPLLQRILETSGRFEVQVSTTPKAPPAAPRLPRDATAGQKSAHAAKLVEHRADVARHQAAAAAEWAAWRPDFSSYAVVVSNYNGEPWPADVRTAFENFVRSGGGFVSYHAANNAFPDWPEYNAMIGLGGWGGRNEKSGPYLRLRGSAWAPDLTPGAGGAHGPQSEFVVDAREPGHPIMQGMPPRFMHTKDELYESLRGPATNVKVLASAYSNRTKEHEPMLMVISYGKGRVFHTALGHAVEAIGGVGFQATFQRGTEWAATGRVTLPPPKPGELTAERAASREIAQQ